jgi:RimJ/RimL family protein N-acetyltransferase
VADYPAHLVRKHRLHDGRTVTVRPIRSSDDVHEREFLNQLSGESRYLRFHKWVNAPSDKLVHFLTDVDYDRHMAFVCTAPDGDAEQVVGEARYVADADGRNCEFGIIIADRWHKSGIAGLLMVALITTARERGLALMEGVVLTSNATMTRFARALGFEVQSVANDPTTRRIVKKL